MRRIFSNEIEKKGLELPNLVFLTGDLGYAALEGVRSSLGDRFINVGVAEQNMISLAAGLSAEGFIVVCYSIAPFAVFRPYEQIKVDVCLHNCNVKIVGNGGGYGYGIMGATHHALEDIAVLKTLLGMTIYLPAFAKDVRSMVAEMLANNGPAYLRLNSSLADPPIEKDFFNNTSWQQLSFGTELVIVSAGPIIASAQELAVKWKSKIAVWQLKKMPYEEMPLQLLENLRTTKKVLILEEHNGPGGIGETLLTNIFEKHLDTGITLAKRCFAKGYPSGLYGTQRWHQEESGIAGKVFEDIVHSILELN